MVGENVEHPEAERLLKLLAGLDFANRYYGYCSRHRGDGQDISRALQTLALKGTGRAFRYDKRERFFAWRDGSAPDGCELGLNVLLKLAQVEWILVFGTPSGHLAGPFAGLARSVKWLTVPGYRHDPPVPVPNISSTAELGDVLDEGLALYDEIAAAIAKQTWR